MLLWILAGALVLVLAPAASGVELDTASKTLIGSVVLAVAFLGLGWTLSAYARKR